MHKVLKATFRRAQIFKHRLNISDWEHVLASSEHLVNSRPINLKYASGLESLVILTPNKLMFGTKSDLNNHINHSELEGIKLFESLHQLDKQIDSWKRIYLDTYIQGARKFSKWQFSNGTLSTEDLVLIVDHINPETNHCSIGRVKEALSNRTYLLEYVKKPAKLSEDFTQISPPLLGELIRPGQALVKLFSAVNTNGENKTGNIILDMPNPGLNSRPEHTKALRMIYDQDIENEILDL